MRNRYYVCLPNGSDPVPWVPCDPADVPIADCRYFGKVLSEFDSLDIERDRTVYLTWNVRFLPSYGDNVIAVVLGDEWCRWPMYASRVRGVFKCYGTRMTMSWRAAPDSLALMSFLQSVNVALRRLPFCVKRLASKARAAYVWDVPLGYYKQFDLPISPIASRAYDVFFAGSINQAASRVAMRRWLRQPKSISRERMLDVLKAYKKEHPERNIELVLRDSFDASAAADGLRYSEALLQAKICVVPRGSSLETFRWFEGMRYGCAVICEKLPSRRYYNSSPAIQVRDWNQLPALLDRLLNDDAALLRCQRASLAWWRNYCSETVVGAFMADRLRATDFG